MDTGGDDFFQEGEGDVHWHAHIGETVRPDSVYDEKPTVKRNRRVQSLSTAMGSDQSPAEKGGVSRYICLITVSHWYFTLTAFLQFLFSNNMRTRLGISGLQVTST